MLYYILICLNSHPPISTNTVRTSQLSLLMREIRTNSNDLRREQEKPLNNLHQEPDKGPQTTFGEPRHQQEPDKGP